MAITSIQRDTNNNVCFVRMISTDTLSTIGSANYIALQQNNINILNGGIFAWFISDMILCSASDGNALFQFTDSTFTTLQQYGSSSSINLGATNDIAYYSAPNVISGLTSIANSILATNGVGVPAMVQTIPLAVQSNITRLGTITQGIWNGTQIGVPFGGTGVGTFTAYSVICGGTTSTGPLQNVSGLGTLGFVLTSTGPGSLPTWQVSAGSGTVDVGTVNAIAYYPAATAEVAPVTSVASATLITSGLGVPSLSQTLPSAVQGNITQLGTQIQILNMGSHQISNVTDPTHAQDAATMNFVNNIAAGLNPISGVYAASTANLAGYTYSNGTAGIGAILTAGSTGFFSVDGVSPPVGSKFLYKDDSTYSGVANGIYVVTTSSGGSNAVLTRWTGYDTPNEIHVGDLLSVEFGTTNAGSSWYQTNTVTTIGTDPIAFSVWFNPASFISSTLTLGHIYIGNASNIAIQSTTTWPNTSTINQILYSSSANTISGLASSNSGVLVTSGAGVPSILAAGTTGQVLQASTAGTPSWSTPTYPSASGSAGVILRSDGTNNVYTTATYPATTTISQLLYSSSSNVIAGLSTANSGLLVTGNTGIPSILAGPGTTGNILQSNAAAAPSFSTATYPSAATSSGTLLRANGTNWVATTSTFADTYLINTLLFAGTANTIVGSTLTSIMDTVLGSVQGDLIYRNATVWTVLAPGSAGQHLQTGGAAANPSWTTSTFPATGGPAGNILISDGTNYIASTSLWPNTVGTSGKFLISNGTSNTYSTSTIPTSAGATANKVLLSDGTNYVLSTPTFPNASATAGKITISDGTNWIASTPTYPNTSGSSGQILISNGTNIVFSTPTYPNTSATSGKIIISDGTNFIASTPTFPNAAGTAFNVLQSDGTNITSTTLSAVMDGAFGSAQGNVLYRSSTGWAALAPGTSGFFLKTQGASANPVWAAASSSSVVVQVKNTETGAVATGTTTIPIDDTIPQNNEGDEYMTLSITPTNSSNKLKIEVVAVCNTSSITTGITMIGALFQDSTANSLAAVWTSAVPVGGGVVVSPIVFTHTMTAGTTSATTFKFRCGASGAGTTTFNGFGAARFFGGVMASSITITEYTP